MLESRFVLAAAVQTVASLDHHFDLCDVAFVEVGGAAGSREVDVRKDIFIRAGFLWFKWCCLPLKATDALISTAGLFNIQFHSGLGRNENSGLSVSMSI
jgi:hypothetical protein